ncbi:uncharacterized protein LOC131003986 [Salvia miltiorrhiza]|uniref:uncharacterized protein LOC131003986 n=1 Tax=Salvia miltiorrhiza TaxID=226208 RepID=UPI0025AD5D72|nr:uncharacterized protein LOC131003986 [Salvia miltiorrhiza]
MKYEESASFKPKVGPPFSFILVSWWHAPPSRIKVNTDGSSIGALGKIHAGGVSRDFTNQVKGSFHIDGGLGFAFEVELIGIIGIITAIELAYAYKWFNIWLEPISTYVVRLPQLRSDIVLWRFIARWRRVLKLLPLFDIHVSHIFCEGNQVADIMENPNTSTGWWNLVIPLIEEVVGYSYPKFLLQS